MNGMPSPTDYDVVTCWFCILIQVRPERILLVRSLSDGAMRTAFYALLALADD